VKQSAVFPSVRLLLAEKAAQMRQLASVTSLSRKGGKSSIRSADILSHFIFALLADLRVPARELRSLFGEART
jgi:hypothetical protein